MHGVSEPNDLPVFLRHCLNRSTDIQDLLSNALTAPFFFEPAGLAREDLVADEDLWVASVDADSEPVVGSFRATGAPKPW